ncbi:MAG: ATP-binding cassette domain-containing protein [Thermomicrobiales bacterium]
MNAFLPTSPAIVTTTLTKQYPGKLALDRLDLSVEQGAMFGFLGPNGAGKTTTIKLLLAFIRPTSGTATIFGHDTWSDGVAIRRNIGYLVQAESLYADRTGLDQLELAARLSASAPILRQPMLDALELSRNDLNRRFGEYSKGMKQKLALIAAMQHDPQLLILDEPSDGLDPLIQRHFLHFLEEFHARGRTVFMSSHDLAEVERVCREIAIVRDGRLVARTTIDEIRRRLLRQVDVTFADKIPSSLDALPGVTVQSRNGLRVVLTVEGPIDPVMRQLTTATIVDLAVIPPGLDDVFMDYYDHPVRRLNVGQDAA